MIGYLRRGRAAAVAECGCGVDTASALRGQFTLQKFAMDQADISVEAAPQFSRKCVRSNGGFKVAVPRIVPTDRAILQFV
jgi:hypothetical protein